MMKSFNPYRFSAALVNVVVCYLLFSVSIVFSRIPIVTDDVNEGRVKVSTCKLGLSNFCPLQSEKKLNYYDMVKCTVDFLGWLDDESTCSLFFTSVVANVKDSCSSVGVGNLCSPHRDLSSMRTEEDERVTSLACLLQQYDQVSSNNFSDSKYHILIKLNFF